tara:strand:+ start:1160 stop:1378 length:219 start_codon:yes stop_codon:yes gene_type:complete
MVKFEELDRKDWEQFRMGTKSHLSAIEFEMVCQLHSKYYKHSYYKPCTCSPKTIKKWIKDLNVIWDNGNKEN